MQSRWVTHKGARIFISDFSNYGTDIARIQAEADSIVEIIQKEPLESILSLAVVEGTNANDQVIRVFQQQISNTNKHIKARAIVGLRGFRRHLLNAFARITGRTQFTIFDTMEEALDYLAKKS